MGSDFSTYNPIRLFGEKRFYTRIINTDYKSQGAFKYGISFTYGARKDVTSIDFNAPAYRARPTIMRKILERYYNLIDLPRPQEELVNTIKEKGLPFGSQPFIISNMDSFIKNCETFFSQTQTHEDMNKVTESKSKTKVMVAEMLNNLVSSQLSRVG